MFDKNIKSLFDLQLALPTEQKCVEYLEYLIWNGKPVSPYDAESKVYKCANNMYKCKNTRKLFNVRSGTCFENTKIPLQKWMFALWIITSHKKGISSLQLAKDINVTQTTAWFLLQRIRACFGIENSTEEKFEGICEADETFVGGKNKNRHKDKKVAQSQGRSFKDKTPIVGVLQRGRTEIKNGKKVIVEYSKVRLKIVGDTKAKTIQPFLKEAVTKDSVLISDEWHGYKGLHNYFDHHVVDHGKKQYVDFDNPEIHSNSMESFWGILKRSYNGIYNWWSRKHMEKYANEFAYRFNLRGVEDGERFKHILSNSNVRTKYKDLIA